MGHFRPQLGNREATQLLLYSDLDSDADNRKSPKPTPISTVELGDAAVSRPCLTVRVL